jgi:hypothetical protein
MGTEMLNITLLDIARRDALAKCEMTDAELATLGITVDEIETEDDGAGFVETDEIVEAEDMYQGFRNRLKDKNCGYRPSLRIVADQRNNVGRRCSYTRNGENLGRVWEIVTPLRDQEFVSYYLVMNVETGEQCIVWDRLLHNLY